MDMIRKTKLLKNSANPCMKLKQEYKSYNNVLLYYRQTASKKKALEGSLHLAKSCLKAQLAIIICTFIE